MIPFSDDSTLTFAFNFYGNDSERLSARKVRLLGVAFCRSIWELFPDDRCRQSVEVAERFADGLADNDERMSGRYEIEDVLSLRGHTYSREFGARFHAAYAASDLCKKDAAEAAEDARRQVRSACNSLGRRVSGANVRSPAPESAIIVDVLGEPGKPLPTFDPRWRTADAIGLARGIYDERAFDRLALLADALMDAGCGDEQVLGHCRSAGPHVRGCWVVDLVLGKE